jgi:thioredoxin-dependent peroxiredoxin
VTALGAPAMEETMLNEGDKVPSFDLESDAGGRVSSKSLAGRPAVVYFYPRDLTPGCTREAIAFSQAAKKFAALGAQVIGISKDSLASHQKFRAQHKLTISLLSDPDLSAHKAFGAYGEKTLYGKKVTGVIRSTFVIGPDGRVAKVFPSVKVDGHADKVLEAVSALAGGGAAKPKAAKPAAKALPAKRTAKK